MTIPAEADESRPTAVARVTVAGQYEFGIVYPGGVTAATDPVADAYRQGFTGALSPLVEVAQAVVGPGNRVLDLGAHLGGFALTAAGMECEVIAVEASATLAACLRGSVELNGLRNLAVVHAAVSDENGVLDFSSLGPWRHVAAAGTGHPAQTVAARRVDDLLEEHGWDKVGFIKLDVEGSEIRALRGMQRLLARPDAPPIFFESNQHTLAIHGKTDADLKDEFRRAGYGLYRVVAPGQLLPLEETEKQTEVCCDYLAAKLPLPAGLRAWLPAAQAATRPAAAKPLIDWVGEAGSHPALPGSDPQQHALTVHADWPVYLAELAYRPLPTVLVLNAAPPPEAEPFLEWFAERGVLLGTTSAVVRGLAAAPRWAAGIRLLLTDADPVRLTNLPANTCLHCLGDGKLPAVPEGCHAEAVAGIEPVLQRQRQRIRAEQAVWKSEPPMVLAPAPVATADAAAKALPPAPPASRPPDAADRRETWLRRGLRMVRIPVIGPMFSWAWAVLDLVGTRRKVLRIDERFAAVTEAQSHAGRDLRDLGVKLNSVEKLLDDAGRDLKEHGQKLRSLEDAGNAAALRIGTLQSKLDAVQGQLDALQQRWTQQLLMPGAELPYAFQRELPDQLESARAGLSAERVPSPSELGDPDVSQMWLGELGGPEARTVLARQYQAYWPWLEHVDGPVLDVGCGAGEWLSFLGGLGKVAVGIDNNAREVERCRRANLNAHFAEAFDWLGEHPGQYAAITLFQVIEHIPRERLHQLLGLLAGALRPGGLLLLETVNPAHPLALSIFYNDPTHQRPLPVEYLGFVCQSAGLRPEATLYTYPVSVAVTGADWRAMHYLNYTVILRKP